MITPAVSSNSSDSSDSSDSSTSGNTGSQNANNLLEQLILLNSQIIAWASPTLSTVV